MSYGYTELKARKYLFQACKLLIDAERQITCSEYGPNELTSQIAVFLKETGCYQTWNPPEWIWKEEMEDQLKVYEPK